MKWSYLLKTPMITTLQAQALKGQSFTHQLSQCVIINGRNFAGKTSRMDAIRLALCGKLPELGGRAKDAFELAEGSSMSVGIELETGAKISRRFWLEKDSVKSSVESDFDADELAVVESTPLFNTSDYFALTDAEKIQFVFRNCPIPSTVTQSGVVARLQALKIGEHTEEIEASKQEWISVCRNKLNDPVVGINALTDKDTGDLALGFTKWNRRAKDSAGAVRILTELKLREGECSAETLTGLDRRIAVVSVEHEQVVREHAALAATAKQSASTNDLRSRLAATVNTPARNWQREIGELAEKEKELSIAAGDNAGLVPPSDTIAKKSYEEAIKIKKEMDTSSEALHAAEIELGKLTGIECCPFCKSKGKGWKTILEEHWNKTISAATERKQTATDAYKAIKSQYDQQNAAYIEAMNKFKREVAAQRPLSAVREQIRSLETGWKMDLETRAAANVSLLDLQGGNESVDPESVHAAGERLKLLHAELVSLRKQRDTAKDLQQDLARAAQAALEHTSAAAHVACIKAIGKEIKTVQQEIIDAAFGGMMTVANKVAGDALLTPLAYHDGQIGRWKDAKFITRSTFSGTEKALCDIGIAAALSAKFPLKIVLLDELARIDAANTKIVLEDLRKCVEEGILDQVIAIDVRDTTYEGWQQIAL